MTRQTWIILALVLGMIGAAAVYLGRQQLQQKLGNPGVVVTNEAIYAHDPLSTNPPVFVNSKRVFLPERVLDYDSEQGFVQPVAAAVLPKGTIFGHREYGNSNRLVDCQVILMGSDRSSIHKPEGCLKGTGFETVSSTPATVRITRPHPYDLPVRRLNLRRRVADAEGNIRIQSGVLLYWFVADGDVTSEHFHRMWSMARGLLTSGVLQRWAYVICYSPCELGQEEESFADLKDFVSAIVPEFHLTAGSAEMGARAEAK